jgi:hypothetical protein
MRIRPLIAVTLFAAGSLLLASCDPAFSPSTAKSFTVVLGGENVRPTAIVSTGSGLATFTLLDTTITYELKVTNLTGITTAHLHVGSVTGTGPILVTLVANGTAPAGTFSGTLSTGTLSAASVGAAVPVSFASLVSLMRNGDAYVDVHTSANAAGEIRGQLVPTH